MYLILNWTDLIRTIKSVFIIHLNNRNTLHGNGRREEKQRRAAFSNTAF